MHRPDDDTVIIDGQSYPLFSRVLTRASLSDGALPRGYRSLTDEEWELFEEGAAPVGYSTWRVPLRFRDAVLVCSDSPTELLGSRRVKIKGELLIKETGDGDSDNNNNIKGVTGASESVVLRFKHEFPPPETSISIRRHRFLRCEEHPFDAFPSDGSQFLRRPRDFNDRGRIHCARVVCASGLAVLWVYALYAFFINI